MRIKDENKKREIFFATIETINKVGFVNISMSKIAKEAGVSTSTLYTYYENKEDMFQKVYNEAKKHMLGFCLNDIDIHSQTKKAIRKLCWNIHNYVEKYNEYFMFLEQANNSPLIDLSLDSDVNLLLEKSTQLFEQGIAGGELKDLSPYLLNCFCFYPITQLHKNSYLKNGEKQDIDFESVFHLVWDAIKNNGLTSNLVTYTNKFHKFYYVTSIV